MFSRLRSRLVVSALISSLALFCASHSRAQDEFDEEAADPIKLFNLGQDAHAGKDYERALDFYERALALRPEFAEAEHQKGGALVSLKRTAEAEKAFRRAAELKPEWALPHASLGVLLSRMVGREREAETSLSRALEIDAKNLSALVALSELRARRGDARGSLELLRRATDLKGGDASLWLARAAAERSTKDYAGAARSFSRALSLEPDNAEARLGRADALLEAGDAEQAAREARPLEAAAPSDPKIAFALVNLYGRAELRDDALRVLDSLPDAAKNSEEAERLRRALTATCDDSPQSRASLEKLIEAEPRNASALACLGNVYRTSDPSRSAEFYRRAAELEPANVSYAVGYAAALVQLRQFPPAVAILRRVLEAVPDNYAARTNLAAAYYEMGLYKEALVEYKWINQARPDLALVHYLTGTAHDRLGEFQYALAAYEKFLERADPGVNQLEIEKVRLRLPSLRNQIKRGEGVKAKKRD